VAMNFKANPIGHAVKGIGLWSLLCS